jgi:Tol biopolymer transport system component/tRNA A-37 threonylcarbamoyl transferase component Bud32
MAFAGGARLGPYEIVSALGAGGMGEVYKARDTKLGREVALKILPESFTHDPERLARFRREAQVLAALNHPHIGAIYGLDEANGQQFLVLELIEGGTLADRIAKGPLRVDNALAIAKQVAEALEAAHEKGIIHRDLKPANIALTQDGNVKVLDFGLAKATETSSGTSPDVTNTPTITSPAMMTGVGVILGTAAYMSPEQAKGRAVDRRSDVWAFGCVLYEMLTGKRAFEGEEVFDTLASVLRGDPDWSRLSSTTPPSIQRMLRRALKKDPRQRLADIHDARIEIEEAGTDVEGPVAPASAKGVRMGWIASLALAATLIAAMAIPTVHHLREASPPTPPEMRLQINTPSTPAPFEFALSPDGRRLAVVAAGDGPRRLWLRPLDETDAQPIAGTEGAEYPFWSADSRSIGFFASNKLYRIDLAGGQPQFLANAPSGRGGAWNADGTIVFAAAATSALSRIRASGGDPAPVTRLDSRQQTSHRFPQFLPDNHHFLFYAQGSPETSGIYLGSLDSGEPKRLTASETAGAYLQPDWVVFVRQGALVARRLDVARGGLTGDPVRLADPVGYDGPYNVGGFSVSADGLVAYRAGGGRHQLTWFDRTGNAVGLAGESDTGNLLSAELSPDGRRVAVDRTVQNNTDVWLMDLVRGGSTRLTFDAAVDKDPVWSPDGTQVVFGSNRKGVSNLYLKSSSGVGTEELLLETPNYKTPQDWSKDGRFLLYGQLDPKTGQDVWALEMTGKERKPRVVVNTPADERRGQFSPNGRWVAYDTNESGRSEIVVQPFPEPGRKWQVSTSGGIAPRWREDGKELYFIAPDGKLMVVSVAASSTAFEAGTPAVLFPTRIVTTPTPKNQYAVSRDGRFLINQRMEESITTPITLILNWNPVQKK